MLFTELELETCTVLTASRYFKSYMRTFNPDDFRIFDILISSISI